jgi:hypothetical protein
MLQAIKTFFSKKPFEPKVFTGELKCWGLGASEDFPLTDLHVNQLSQHPEGLIRRLSNREKVQVDSSNQQVINFTNAVVVNPHTFFDMEDWVRASKPESLQLGSTEHMAWVLDFFKSNGFDGLVIDDFRNLPQSFYNRTFSNRRSTIGMLSWDSVITIR